MQDKNKRKQTESQREQRGAKVGRAMDAGRGRQCAVPRQSPQRQHTAREGICSAASAQPGVRPSNRTDQIQSLPTDKNIKTSYLLIELIIFGGQVRKPSVFKLLKKPQFLVKNKNYMLLGIK